MKFGILPPYRAGVCSDPVWMAGFAKHAEEVGIESIYVIEHVAVPAGYRAAYPYSASGRMPLPDECHIPDPLELLAYLAAVTDTIVLATGLLVLPEHHPLQLAKRVSTIDVLSAGRVRLGIGIGWMREELQSVGVDFDSRGRRTDELLRALRLIWSTEIASFHGQFFAFDEVYSRPHPVKVNGVPIHIGGHSRAAARRAGMFGDGFQPLGLDAEQLADRLVLMRDVAEAEHRDPDAIEVSLSGLLEETGPAEVDAARSNGAVRLVLSTHEPDLDMARHEMDAFADRVRE